MPVKCSAASKFSFPAFMMPAGEIIAKATDDHTVIGGHHRLAVAASLGRKLFWKDTGEPVKLDPFFKGSHQNTA